MKPEQIHSGDSELEAVHSAENSFVQLLRELDIPPELILALESHVLPGTQITRTREGSCFFRNVGFIENGITDDRYEMILSDEILESRARRLKGVLPEGHEDRVAIVWIAAHELGHGLEAAYSHINQYEETEGTFAGIITYRYATDEYLNQQPEAKMAPNFIDANRIERERRAEGFAQEILVREMQKLGMDNAHIVAAVHKLYEPSVQRAEALAPLVEMTSETVPLADIYDGRVDELAGKKLNPQFVKHEIGYAYPMPVDEIARRYKAVS